MTKWVHCDATGVPDHECHVKMLVDEIYDNPGIHVEREAPSTFADPNRPLDFCSWRCLAAFAREASKGEEHAVAAEPMNA